MKNFLYALFSGIFLALAWPTYGFPLLLFIGFVPLLYAEFCIRTSDTGAKSGKSSDSLI